MKTLLTDTVASVSGTYNETLTMTTGGMTVNLYKNLYFEYQGTNYVIASNTATTITLITPTTAYDDLSSASISIIQHYANYQEAKNAIMRSASRTDNKAFNTDFAITDELLEALQNLDDNINLELGLDSDEENTDKFTKLLRKIETDVIALYFVRAKIFSGKEIKKDALGTPDLTSAHLLTLHKIKAKIKSEDEDESFVFNVNTGGQIT